MTAKKPWRGSPQPLPEWMKDTEKRAEWEAFLRSIDETPIDLGDLDLGDEDDAA
jgi:hypothetical protein